MSSREAVDTRRQARRHRASRDAACVFAYGTLLEPARVDALVGTISRWRYLGKGTVQGQLYDAGAYPAFRPSMRLDEQVPGVVIEFDNGTDVLGRLDAYEEVGAGLYRRERCRVHLVVGGAMEAWVYVYCPSVSDLRRILAWPLDFGDVADT